MYSVTVIIPIYNAEKDLRRCLDSIGHQTLRNIEIICIDDGSSDESANILLAYAAKDVRMRILTQKNAGQGVARNNGLEVAHGEYVYFMDADDELLGPEVFCRLVDEMGREDLDVLFFDAKTVIDEDVKMPVFHAESYIKKNDYSAVKSGRRLFFDLVKNREYTPSPCLAIYRRAFIEENNIRFPSERIFYEDNIFMTHVMLAAKRASHRPWQLYLRKVHAASTVTSKPTMRHLRGYLACYKDACELLEKNEWDRNTRKALVDRSVVYKLNVRRIIDSYPDLFDCAQKEMDKDEFSFLHSILEYPITEKVVNGLRCLREHGIRYTVKRILFGRQK